MSTFYCPNKCILWKHVSLICHCLRRDEKNIKWLIWFDYGLWTGILWLHLEIPTDRKTIVDKRLKTQTLFKLLTLISIKDETTMFLWQRNDVPIQRFNAHHLRNYSFIRPTGKTIQMNPFCQFSEWDALFFFQSRLFSG